MIGFLNKPTVGKQLFLTLSFIGLAVIGIIYCLQPSSYLGFSSLELQADGDSACNEVVLPSPDLNSALVWPTASNNLCSFNAKIPNLLRGASRATLVLQISGEGSLLFSLWNESRIVELKSKEFKEYSFEIGNGMYALDDSAEISIKKISGESFVRKRVEFYSDTYIGPKVVSRHLDNLSYLKLGLLTILLFLFLYILVYGDINSRHYLTTVALSALFFLSPKLFYYFDEWHVLERFSKLGFPGVIYTHNEHSIIAFFVWYYALVRFFGENYLGLLLVSIILHVLCAFSLEKLLLTYRLDRRAVRASAMFFCFSSLHIEVLQWAFEQSIILSCISGLWGLIFIRRWLQSSLFRHLLLASSLLMFSPLFFGNGFIFFPIAACLIFFEFRFSRIKRYVLPCLTMLVLSSVPVFIYRYLKSTSAGHGVGDIGGQFSSFNFFSYMLTGTGLGTIGRGLGIYPNLTLSSMQTFFYEVFGFYIPWFDQQVINGLSVESSVGLYLWSALILILVIIFYFNKQSRLYVITSLLGLVILLFSFILPAIGRAELGILQSLALRYQYSAMLGFSMMLCPIFYLFLLNRASKLLFYVLALFWMFEQAYLNQTFTYFTDYGSVHRNYVSSLFDWEREAMPQDGMPYEGLGEMKGLFPLAKSSIAPGLHPKQVLDTTKWLRD